MVSIAGRSPVDFMIYKYKVDAEYIYNVCAQSRIYNVYMLLFHNCMIVIPLDVTIDIYLLILAHGLPSHDIYFAFAIGFPPMQHT